MFETEFLTDSPESQRAYRHAIAQVTEILSRYFPKTPYSGKDAKSLQALFENEILPSEGLEVEEALARSSGVIEESIAITHPNTMAHLHCPPLIPALAAEVLISALNQSMDSFDQAPAATVLEERMVRWLCDEVGLGPGASGVFSAGGTQSNYMALLLARDACIQKHWNWEVWKRGLPSEANRLRILCSDPAHFTVEKSAAQLGLGVTAVVRIAVDEQFRMHLDSLHAELRRLREQGLIVMAIVGTAGTTDFGSIDPLPELGAIAASEKAWFHVDAAYGGALLFSSQHRNLLRGIENADSVSMDFHKLLWQPISCAAFLLRDGDNFRHMKLNADYLNPEILEEMGVPNLVTRSVATTRRFDALKLWISLRAVGRKRLGQMIDATIELAHHAAQTIRDNPRLELIHDPTLSAVVFRCRAEGQKLDQDALNFALRQRLFESGLAVIGHTVVRGRRCLKLTCMNPSVSNAQIDGLLKVIVQHGLALEREFESCA